MSKQIGDVYSLAHKVFGGAPQGYGNLPVSFSTLNTSELFETLVTLLMEGVRMLSIEGPEEISDLLVRINDYLEAIRFRLVIHERPFAYSERSCSKEDFQLALQSIFPYRYFRIDLDAEGFSKEPGSGYQCLLNPQEDIRRQGLSDYYALFLTDTTAFQIRFESF